MNRGLQPPHAMDDVTWVSRRARLAVKCLFAGAVETALMMPDDKDTVCGLSFVGRPSSGARDLQLIAALALRPCGLDIVEHDTDLRIAQYVCEAGHVALVSATDGCGGAGTRPDASSVRQSGWLWRSGPWQAAQ